MPQSLSFRLSPLALLSLWFATLPLFLAGLGNPVTQRTQEARVLETSREMLASSGWHQWMIPRLNDKVRLEKPPFAYWMAAGSFKLFGINEYAGRLPFAIAGWLTIAIVYRFARKMIDEQFAFFSAAILLTSWMFFSHFRMAETDAPATLFLTAAVYWLWKAGQETRSARSYAFFQLAGLATGLAALPKGPQAGFAILFFIIWVFVEKRTAALPRLLLSGALLTALIIGASWYLYVRTDPHASILWKEFMVVTRGGDHKGQFYNYFPWILRATVPWTGLVILGVIWGVCIMIFRLFGHYSWWNDKLGWMYKDQNEGSAARDHAARTLVIWAAAVLLPLLLAGNKQNHYLVPLMPPLAMLGAYALCRGLVPGSKERPLLLWVIGITFGVTCLSPMAVFCIGRYFHQPFRAPELILIAVMIAGLGVTAWVARRRGPIIGAAAYTAALALMFPILQGWWQPSLDLVHHRTIAAELRKTYGERPFAYYGKDFSLPLIWNLRQTIPLYETAEELNQKLDQAPSTVVITEFKDKREPPPVPDRLQKVTEYETGDEGAILRIYVVRP